MIHRKHAGARSEMIACVWLLDQGYEVFRNVSQCGLIDVVAIKGGEVLRLDIKGKKSGTASTRLKKAQIEAGVRCLSVVDGVCTIHDLNVDVSKERTCRRCKKAFIPAPKKPRQQLCIICRRSCSPQHLVEYWHAARGNGNAETPD